MGGFFVSIPAVKSVFLVLLKSIRCWDEDMVLQITISNWIAKCLMRLR